MSEEEDAKRKRSPLSIIRKGLSHGNVLYIIQPLGSCIAKRTDQPSLLPAIIAQSSKMLLAAALLFKKPSLRSVALNGK
jgi:hypothetical protein